MNKVEMAGRLAARTGLSKAIAREGVDGVFAAIGDALANGEEVRIAGFGTFGTRSRAARTGRNPRTGEAVSVAPWLGGQVADALTFNRTSLRVPLIGSEGTMTHEQREGDAMCVVHRRSLKRFTETRRCRPVHMASAAARASVFQGDGLGRSSR